MLAERFELELQSSRLVQPFYQLVSLPLLMSLPSAVRELGTRETGSLASLLSDWSVMFEFPLE